MPNRKIAKPRILIVEDDEDVRESLREVIQDEGYDTMIARNGREALCVLSLLGDPCVVLLDLMMPVMNGWELLAILKHHAVLCAVPVVVLSANGDPESAVGADRFIQKPVNLPLLISTLEQMCGQKVPCCEPDLLAGQ